MQEMRLDKYLAQTYPYSRNFFEHIIEKGYVRVDGKVAKKSHPVSENSVIEVESFERYTSNEIMNDFAYCDLPIIHQTMDYAIIYKPKGVLSHPVSIWDVSTPSVVGFLYHHFGTRLGGVLRAGLVHRLDKETDGVMIVALSERGVTYFGNLFKEKSEQKGSLRKFYRAISTLHPRGKKFLSQPISFPYRIEMIVRPKTPNPVEKLGISLINHLSCTTDRVESDLEIITGRTHQIRYHLSQLGLPIVGDTLYGGIPDQQMHLCAYKLEFTDLDGTFISHSM